MNNLKYIEKLRSFFYEDIKNTKNIKILEFGVREGNSTKFFLELCEKNNGKLYSVDIDDYSKLFNDNNWKFINTSDDNFDKVIKEAGNQFDLIFIDSFHNPQHVKKLILFYFHYLKKNGLMIIDDISWVPYCKNNYRDHPHTEVINRETFLEILKLIPNNQDIFKVHFSFEDSGLAKIIKLDNEKLKESTELKDRSYSIKNMLKKILK